MEQEIGCEHGRRRRWSLEEKRAVVELSLDPESSVVEVAGAFDLVPDQIYAWRRELREVDIRDDEAPMFLPAVAEPASSPAFMTEPDVAPSLLPTSQCRWRSRLAVFRS